LLYAKNNVVEKCLEMLGPSRKKGTADINCRDSEGWTALHHSCWNGNLNFLNILLYNDSQIEVKDKSGVNPLTLSVARGNSEITQVSNTF
jgi:ankyrin repeat protein